MNPYRNIRLRPASAHDEPFLLALRQETMAAHHERLGLHLSEADDLARIRFHFEDAHVVCDGEDPIGLFKAFRVDDGWVLSQVQVHPAHQGRGIGEMLIRGLMTKAKADGLPVRLQVLKGNPAQQLYCRLGFEKTGVSEHSISMIWLPV